MKSLFIYIAFTALFLAAVAPMAVADEIGVAAFNKVVIDNNPSYPSVVFEPGVIYCGGYYNVPYLLISNDRYAEGDLYLAQVSPSGSLERTVTINDQDVVIMYHASAGNGKIFIAYDQWVDTTFRRDIYYALIDVATGNILSQGTVVNAEGYQEYVATAYSPGLDMFAVAYFDSSENNIYVKLYDSTGNQVAETSFIPIGHDYYYAAFTLIGGQNGFLLLYNYEQYGQRDLYGEYITSDGTMTDIEVYTSLDGNETPGYNFNIYNPVTGRKSRVMQPIQGAYLDGYFIVPFTAYTSNGQVAYVAIINEQTLEVVDTISLGPGDHPQAVAGGGKALVVYRDTSSDAAGDAKAVLITMSDGQPSTTEVMLSSEMGTSDSREGFVKASYSPARNLFITAWAAMGEAEKYEAIATSIRPDGLLAQGYSVIEDNPETGNTPYSIAADENGGFAILVSMSYRPTTNNTDLELVVGALGEDIPAPIHESLLVPVAMGMAALAATGYIASRIRRSNE